MFHSTPEDQSAFECAVVGAATLHERRSYRSDGNYHRVFHLDDFDPSYPGLTVKYTDHVTLYPENLMLQHLYALACEDGDAAPHVPQPVHYFHPLGGWGCMGYIVMERIELCPVSDDELCVKAARAVQWLRTKHLPRGVLFGSLGESSAHHAVFQNSKAPLRPMFRNVALAEKYLNRAVFRARREWNQLTDVSLADDDVVLTQSDMNAGNFGVDPNGRAGLPLTLANFTLLRTTAFATAVSKHVFNADERAALLASPSIKSLAEARRFLSRTFDDSLGLDEDGNFREGRRRAAAESPGVTLEKLDVRS
ncbi:hypothetical protein B0H16DRAFT_1451071 [Mycena metata]|uniref:Uncharacterized protein n=1 Tax=Mycena metata TaxID=1033252 RepID=A0AAD7NSX2_9AGAR|nr:hypothetical protein B0H16DRAFT_1451071 [Mycena metata]